MLMELLLEGVRSNLASVRKQQDSQRLCKLVAQTRWVKEVMLMDIKRKYKSRECSPDRQTNKL